MYVMNPEEVPSPPSWEIGKQLVEQLLAEQLKTKGRYPRKVAFTLNSFATFQDYGVMESQILYLLGVRPVWDDRHRVVDVELIPAAQLGRPRIDVFISALGYYRDMLPTRMRLLDKAVRLVAALDEPGNQVYRNSVEVRKELRAAGDRSAAGGGIVAGADLRGPAGPDRQRRLLLSRGAFRPMGHPRRSAEHLPGLLPLCLYRKSLGPRRAGSLQSPDPGERGAAAKLVRPHRAARYPISTTGTWAAACRWPSGNSPGRSRSGFFPTSAIRIAPRCGLRKTPLARDYRVRLFNRKWIEGMMREGYAGADQIAIHVSNTMGWKIMRDGSVSDETWNEIAAIYVRDKLGLSLRQWFEAENPFAFQDMSEVLLESSRKGYWKAEPGMIREVAERYARSVVRHGEGGGLRGGGNQQLEQFVAQTLKSAQTADWPNWPRHTRIGSRKPKRLRPRSSPARRPGRAVRSPLGRAMAAPAQRVRRGRCRPAPAAAAAPPARRAEAGTGRPPLPADWTALATQWRERIAPMAVRRGDRGGLAAAGGRRRPVS